VVTTTRTRTRKEQGKLGLSCAKLRLSCASLLRLR
jgi:hypothetical protein